MNGFRIAWLTWVAMFAIVEGTALHVAKRTGNHAGTLSAHLAHLFNVRTKTGKTVWAVAVTSAAAALWAHIHWFWRE